MEHLGNTHSIKYEKTIDLWDVLVEVGDDCQKAQQEAIKVEQG